MTMFAFFCILFCTENILFDNCDTKCNSGQESVQVGQDTPVLPCHER